MKILNGIGLGVVIALMPESFFKEIANHVGLDYISPYLTLCTNLMCAVFGICVAKNFKLDAIATATLTFCAFIAGGSMIGVNEQGRLLISGTGDIINCFLGIVIALLLIHFLDNRLGAYRLILLPAITVFITCLIVLNTAAPVKEISIFIGNVIRYFTTLAPLLMYCLIAISFGVIIVSPISSVAIALMISIDHQGAGAATLGIACMSTSLCIFGYGVNGLGTSIAHFIGSPKLQLENFIKNPKIVIPGMISAGICSVLVTIFNIQGTPLSAGFGLTGLVGPIGHLNIVGYTPYNIMITILVFFGATFSAGYILKLILMKQLKLFKEEEYKVDINN